MNDDDVVSRVRSAVESQVAGVRSAAPGLTPRYDTGATEIRPRRVLRWAVPAALAAAAVVVLGAVLVTRGNDTGDIDVAATTVAPDGSGLERWVLDLAGATVYGAEDATTSSVAIGTNVYYDGGDGRTAAVRTNGASALASRSSWPTMDTVTVQGVQATRYLDPDQQLLVAPTDPPLIVETTGGWDAAQLAAGARLDAGVWVVDATELGRRTPEDLGLRYSSLQYRSAGHTFMITVVDHPAGARGSLLDSGRAAGDERVVNGITFVPIDPGSWMLLRDRGPAVSIIDSSPDGPSDEVLAALKQVSDAEWRALVAPVRPDLATPGSWAPYPTTTVAAGPVTTYRAIGTVIEVPGVGVELCLGGVDESLPPQCSGITVSPPEWRWPEGTFEQSADGTRWSEYYVEGTYDGTTFTSTIDPHVPTPDDRALFPQTAIDYTTPCPAPAGGWAAAAANAPTDPAAFDTLTTAASSQPDYVGMWVDQSLRVSSPGNEGGMNDPTKLIVNVAFTGDVDRHRSELAKLWTGALCVIQSPGPSLSELQAIQTALPTTDPGFLSSDVDVTRGVLTARYVLATPELQDALDAKFGKGVVTATSALQPIP